MGILAVVVNQQQKNMAGGDEDKGKNQEAKQSQRKPSIFDTPPAMKFSQVISSDNKRDFAMGILAHLGTQSLSVTIQAPLERIKILLQVQHVHKGIHAKERFKGTINCASKIIKNQGIISFFRGNQVELVKVPIHEYLHVMIPPIFKKVIVTADIKKERKRYFFEAWLSGLAETATYLILLYPLDVLRVRVATDIGYKRQREYRGSLDCFRTILRNDGFQGLFSGFSCQASGMLLQRSFSYAFFTTAKAAGLFETDRLTLQFALAMFLSFASEALTYPFAVIMKRMMLQAGHGTGRLFKNPIDCLKMTLQREGPRGLYRGYLLSVFITFNRFLVTSVLEGTSIL
ncbi:hypothetical protein FGO68_gene639 [Halteria grandinella]|uniref:ADP/ATP translocase n=1 Tax=Halteria grandinella TaxID=5974 RepID=A0A8J8T035_HALGN|nr:hypothetical protein FGO68_gene639 [Halteria grandinella]